jgi:hypothetical protein
MSSLASHSGGAFSIHRFGALINCIDGRVQERVARWLKLNHQLDYIDTITEPGPDKQLADGGTEIIAALRRKVEFAVTVHKPGLVALAGHHDCLANPVARQEHIDQIKRGVEIIRLWNLPVTVIGLWINEHGTVEPVT